MRRQCAETGEIFEITARDQEFYDRIGPVFGGRHFSVPPPRLSPAARERRRLVWRNERTLYQRKCDRTGKTIVSTYAPEAPCPVWAVDEWLADTWDALDYGREIDFTRPFFEQFHELLCAVPAMALMHQGGNENCPFTNLVTRNNDCYYIFAASENETCFYSTYLHRCRNVSDCFFVTDSELCYECIDCSRCYEVEDCQDCEQCSRGAFLRRCSDCSDCFGCAALAKRRFCMFNEQLTEAKYIAALAEIRALPGWRDAVSHRLESLSRSMPQRACSGFEREGCTGDHIFRSRNADHCFDVTGVEDCRFCTWMHNARDCYDCYAWGVPGELGLENHLCGNGFYHCLFNEQCWNGVSDLLYSRACLSSSHLFGCIGLKRKEHCILNRRYVPAEYQKLAARLVEHMMETGEWGEFFPQTLSPYGYNETVADEYFPMSREDVRTRGWSYRDLPPPGVFANASVEGASLPDDADGITDSLADETIRCAETGRSFRFTRSELALYRLLRVPPPRACFDSRYRRRFAKRAPRLVLSRECSACGNETTTALDAAVAPLLYCERCFEQYRRA